MNDSWRCDLCNTLIFNRVWLNGNLYPAPGAPVPKFISPQLRFVCTLCFELHQVLKDSQYFLKLEEEKEKNLKKNKPGSDYLAR